MGERIRKLRKQKKMTLEALAGEEITKGMLSLIENNKANPSMESLTYIAERLGVEVAVLMESVSSQELREVLEEAEKLYNIEFEQKTDEYKRIITLVAPYIDKLTQGYEAARLLEMYSRCVYHEKSAGWEELSDRAAEIYEQMNLTAKRADVGLFRAMVKFSEHDYAQSLNILLRERAEVEANHAYIDPMTHVDFDYHEALLHFAIGDTESATRVMESAIDYSKKHRIFYRIDDLYRIAAASAMMTGNDEKKLYYTKKLKQYGDFADDLHSIIFYDLINAETLITEDDYVGALEIIDPYLSDPRLRENYGNWFYLGKGKSLYGLGRYEEALHWLEKIIIPSYAHHPFDLSLFFVMDSYKALCHMHLGNPDEALESAKLAVKNIAPLPHTPFKDFIHKTYQAIEKTKPAVDF
nr:helix-turn-helix transcriptional regulator [Lederbergia citrea]